MVCSPGTLEEEAFLKKVVTPIYEVIAQEAARSKKATSKHSQWRNYDDLNEYFWSANCFRLGWPMRANADFFCKPVDQNRNEKNGVLIAAQESQNRAESWDFGLAARGSTSDLRDCSGKHKRRRWRVWWRGKRIRQAVASCEAGAVREVVGWPGFRDGKFQSDSMTIRRSLQRQTARQPIDRPSFGLTPTMAAMTLGGTEFAGLSICDWDIKIEPNTILSGGGSVWIRRETNLQGFSIRGIIP
ncbi:hypothetical protein CASFOL_031722 [Castilleja foliolosa]|uniref:1,3-beta-glucan synthase component FKS1-like domain-containing protein n=1 Tax=Castilleja foliolosa TaxID=1961234 RepID=A0ABD3C6I4_9LAMI